MIKPPSAAFQSPSGQPAAVLRCQPCAWSTVIVRALGIGWERLRRQDFVGDEHPHAFTIDQRPSVQGVKVPIHGFGPIVCRPENLDVCGARAGAPSAEAGESVDCCGH